MVIFGNIMAQKTKKNENEASDYYDLAKTSLSIEHLLHAPTESTLKGIFESLLKQLEQLKENEVFEEGTLLLEIKILIDEIANVILRIQEHGNEGIPPDTLVVLFFRLGIAIGRQEGLGFLAPLVRRLSELIVEEADRANLGRIEGGDATKDKFSYPYRLAKKIIPQYAIKYPKRLNFKGIAHGVKADLRRKLVEAFDINDYKTESGNSVIPTQSVLDKHVNKALTKLKYQD